MAKTKEELNQKMKEKENKLNDEISKLNKKIKELEDNIEELQKTIKNKDIEIENLTNKLNEVQGQIDGYKAEMEKAKNMAEEAKNKYDELIISLEEQYKKKNEDLINSFNEKTKEFREKFVIDAQKLKEEFLSTLSSLENKNKTLTKENTDLQNYLAKRPSRDEDLDEISRLNEELEKKEKEIVDNKVLLEQLRNELINREETYNGYFDRKPKVGYVDPIKAKKENDKRHLKSIKK